VVLPAAAISAGSDAVSISVTSKSETAATATASANSFLASTGRVINSKLYVFEPPITFTTCVTITLAYDCSRPGTPKFMRFPDASLTNPQVLTADVTFDSDTCLATACVLSFSAYAVGAGDNSAAVLTVPGTATDTFDGKRGCWVRCFFWVFGFWVLGLVFL
jgi:hypothetical protein